MKPMDVNAWISFPLTRGVKELDINIHVKEPDKLPSAIFGCQTLEVLKLDTNLDLELPPSVCLPNLKELHINVVHFPADDSLTRSKLVLDVPNLENLDYTDYNALCYSIGGLNSLVEARIHLHLVYMNEQELENIWSLVNPMSNVRSLFLEYGFVEALDIYDFPYKLPIFRNLNHLLLGGNGYYSWNKVLLELLNCAPFLDTLEYPRGIMAEIDEQHEGYLMVTRQEIESWSRTQVIPSCLMFHLKRIIIEEYWQTEWELEMVKYSLRNASVLEELMVVCKTSEPLADKIQLGCTLQKLPRE